MEWNWLQSLIFGFLSGFAEFLPVSADAHQQLFRFLTGADDQTVGFRLICQIFALAALLLSLKTRLKRLLQERRIAAASPKRRKRNPDRIALMDLRFLRTAAVPMLLVFVIYNYTCSALQNFWVLPLILAVNGLILYLPQFFPRGNKESQSMSALDSLLVGLAGALGVIPGISRVGALISAAQLRGTDGRYAADTALLLSIPALIVLIGFDIYSVSLLQSALSMSLLFSYILAAAASFAGAYFGILLLRFLAVKTAFSGFAYYCWGVALFCFVLYLMI